MFISPMLAASLPEKKRNSVTYDNGYILEPKHDGMRAVVSITEDGVEVYSRVGKTYADRIPKLVEQFEKLPVGTTLDGELMVASGWVSLQGSNTSIPVPDFNMTMRIMGSNAEKAIAKQEEAVIQFFAFDVIRWAGKDLTNEPYLIRNTYLTKLASRSLYFVDVAEPWEEWDQSDLDNLVAAGIEGAILKHVESIYLPGKRRANTWYKHKIVTTADVVVMGFTEAKEGKTGKFKGKIGAIIFGAYDESGILQEVGQCSGMTDAERDYWTEIWNLVDMTERVIEIRYNDLVGDGTPRHPQYVTERFDKDPKDCTLDQFRK